MGKILVAAFIAAALGILFWQCRKSDKLQEAPQDNYGKRNPNEVMLEEYFDEESRPACTIKDAWGYAYVREVKEARAAFASKEFNAVSIDCSVMQRRYVPKWEVR